MSMKRIIPGSPSISQEGTVQLVPYHDPYADDTRHILETRDGDWSIRHPRNCHPDFPCNVQLLAEQSAHIASLGTGRYYCWNDGGSLIVGQKVQ